MKTLFLLLLFSLLLDRELNPCYAQGSPRPFPITVMPNSLPLNESDSAFIYVPSENDSIIQCYVTKYSELEFLIIYRSPSKDCIYTLFEGFIADVVYIGRNLHVKLEND
jgi:hypothetical protein